VLNTCLALDLALTRQQFLKLYLKQIKRYIKQLITVKNIRIIKSLTSEVGRNGSIGARRERIVEIVKGARVKSVKVVFVLTVVIKRV
jgi:hypothetical protein